jgi:ferredoxin
MGATIFYFSATGNSLKIAGQLAKALGDCTVRSMAAGQPEEPVGGPGNPVGFVFPCYFIGLPRIVRDFVENLNLLEHTYCFALITYGGMTADTPGMLDDILKSRGASLSYVETLKMPGNFIVKYPAYASDVVEKLIVTAMEKAEAAAAAIAEGRLKPVKRSAKLISRLANRRFLYNHIPQWDEKFRTTERCISCGLCARICPVDNIKMEGTDPVWQNHCERCMACIQWCPTEAIEDASVTEGRKRYRYPGMTAEEIIIARELK